ncbi:hypothetical protein SAMN05216317_103176 [Nitrosomonas eutropha]|uniref:Uncharacterized protein n=2 Tax=Nitrosomonas eutropha TaxID=916 RepID=A0ABX5M6Z3_9PROT|nr:transposase-like protein [Nitrosomonas eutropha C91]PXV81129.1 hypothetical protein C8R14_1125 [Nitrosomonas eutropha]SDW26329.1 hypothetical protein SAMN05216317_103176 [Nitrosomonas eutropha]SEI76370.1 hypothetical protein SAMN05216318_11065 [Nitrosomonas eutropha]
MPRLLLNAELWLKLLAILLHNHLYNKQDLRMTVEGILYRMVPVHSGAGARFINDAPPGLSAENGSRYFRLWWLSWTWSGFLSMVAIKAHQHSASGKDKAIGKSQGR